MTTKEHLESLRSLNTLIDTRLERAMRFRARTEYATRTFSPDKGRGSAPHDPMGDAVTKLVDMERELNALIDELVDKKEAAILAFKAMPDQTAALILEMRYLDGKNWEQIAQATTYSSRQVKRIHMKAMETVCIATTAEMPITG